MTDDDPTTSIRRNHTHDMELGPSPGCEER